MTSVKGTGAVLRLALRRDWVKMGWWLIGLVGLMASAAAKFGGLYGTQAEMNAIATTLKTPAMVALLGPFTASKPYTTAMIYGSEMMVFMGLFTAMMAIDFAVHGSRTQEDTGRDELLLARAVGRQAPLLASILELVIVNVGIGVLEALGLIAARMPGATAAGNWLFGLGLAAFGIMFGGLALVFAQLASNTRSAMLLNYGWLGLVFVARMGTDVQNPDLTWWTLFGWIEKLDLYTKNTWWPLALMLGAAALFIALALGLASARDIGSGLIQPRAGRRTASRWLRGPLTLIARLNRTSTVVWLIGLLLLGASYGSIFGTIGNLIKTNPMMGQLLGGAAVNAANRAVVLSMANKLAIIFVVVASVPAIMAVLSLNQDEQKGYLAVLHAKPLPRWRLATVATGFGLAVGTAAFALAIVGMALAGQQSMTATTISLGRFMRGFYGYWPALMVVSGLALTVAGWWPQAQKLLWLVPVYGVISLYLGPLFDLPKWALRLTPYGWVNAVPQHAVAWGTVGWMTLLGLALVALGLVGYRRRDLLMN